MSNEFSPEFRRMFFVGLEEIARATGFEPVDVEAGAPHPDQLEALLGGAYIYAVSALADAETPECPY